MVKSLERTGFIIIIVGVCTTACNAQNHRSSWSTPSERELPAFSEVEMCSAEDGDSVPQPSIGPLGQAAQDLLQLRYSTSATVSGTLFQCLTTLTVKKVWFDLI